MKRHSFTWIAYAILLSSLTTLAQPDTVWTRTYNISGQVVEILAVDDGVICLSTGRVWENDSVSHTVSMATKISADGDTTWSNPIAGQSPNLGVVTAVLDYEETISVLTEWRDSLNAYSYHVMRLNQDGEIIGSSALPLGTRWNTIDNSVDSLFWFTGRTTINGRYDLRLLKMDIDGQIRWERVIGDSAMYDDVSALTPCPAGDALIVGFQQLDGSGFFPFATLVDSNGEQVWTRTISYADDYGEFHDACYMPDGGFLIAGNKNTFPGPSSGWFVRMDVAGDTLWTREYTEGNQGYGSAPFRVFQAIGGGYFAVGTAVDIVEPWIIKISSDGSRLLHHCCWGNGMYTQLFCAVELTDGTLYMAGRNYVSGGVFPYLVRFTQGISAIEPSTPAVIDRIALHPNYPNPFNATTEIGFDLPRAMQASLKVYGVLGREVGELVDGVMNAGTHYIMYDASALSSGVYFYRLEAGVFVETRKMVLMK